MINPLPAAQFVLDGRELALAGESVGALGLKGMLPGADEVLAPAPYRLQGGASTPESNALVLRGCGCPGNLVGPPSLHDWNSIHKGQSFGEWLIYLSNLLQLFCEVLLGVNADSKVRTEPQIDSLRRALQDLEKANSGNAQKLSTPPPSGFHLIHGMEREAIGVEASKNPSPFRRLQSLLCHRVCIKREQFD